MFPHLCVFHNRFLLMRNKFQMFFTFFVLTQFVFIISIRNIIMEMWHGKFAVVTGAFSGIGEATTKDLLAKGVNVIGLDKNMAKFDEILKVVENLPGKFYAKHCNVSDVLSIKDAFSWIEHQFKVISIMINCAGVSHNVKLLDDSNETSDKLSAVIDTNFAGVVHCTREAVRLMKKSDDYALIVNICSVLGYSVPFSPQLQNTNVYAATKHAVKALSDVIRHELLVEKNEKIRVTNISPGAVRTSIYVAGGYTNSMEELYKDCPVLEPENVSQAIIFLLSTPSKVNVTDLLLRPLGEAL